MHIEVVKSRQGDKVYQSTLIRQSYRVGKKVRKRTLANISHLPPEIIEVISRSLRGEVFVPASQAVQVTRSVSHGAVFAILTLMQRLGMAKLLGSRPHPWHRLVLGMVAARLANPGSKRFTRSWWDHTSLPALLGLEEGQVTVNELYEAMDALLERQPAIEAALAKKHLQEGALVLYDLSSTYLEGRTCPLARYGHNRDKKRGKKQFTYGLLTNREGCPVAIEVFPGNTMDSSTVGKQIEKLRERFGFRRVVLVGDRGMIAQTRVEDLQQAGYGWITALKAKDIQRLHQEGALQLSVFDEVNLLEIEDPARPEERLVACRNPLVAEERRRKREDLLRATEAQFDKIRVRVEKGRLTESKEIGLAVGKVINRWKMGKHFELTIEPGVFEFRRKEASIEREAVLDGIYIVRTSVPRAEMAAAEVVASYKSLQNVEQAFRSMKTMQLELRPVFHRLEDRVRAHTFLCMLAYYVQWHMERALEPLKESDPNGYGSLRLVLERLSAIQLNTLQVQGAVIKQVTTPDEMQQKILDRLEIKALM